jgi:stress response protein SCP2
MLDKNNKVDLDASCILINEIGEVEDAVFFNQLRKFVNIIVNSNFQIKESKCGFITHSGDIKAGE